jgi:CheY-like chemotaxis protein/anti-sigma regulatory factor (Ser/Thr protein kinase)
LLNLINEILDLSRIESGRLAISPEAVRIRSSVVEVVDLLKVLADRSQVDLQMGNLESGSVLADRKRLQQILVNLVTNAIKYNHPGGQVLIDCLERSNHRLRICIRDTGPGIAPDKIGQLFVPFERLGAELGDVEGTGLGLALSQSLVEAMQGQIGAESKVGEGSTFWFDLPMAESVPALDTPIRGSMSLQTVATNRICSVLYIEDNPSNLKLVRAIFELRPAFQLLSALTGADGLARVRAERPDLILLDLNLPDMNGLEILQQLQTEPGLCEIPIVVISADVTAGQSERLLAAGARAYLGKPINVAELLALTDTLLS